MGIITHVTSLCITAASYDIFVWRINEITRGREEWKLLVKYLCTSTAFSIKIYTSTTLDSDPNPRVETLTFVGLSGVMVTRNVRAKKVYKL